MLEDPAPTDLRKLGPRNRSVMKEIRKLQGPNAPTFLIPRLSFQKLVREIMTEGQSSLKFHSDALVVLQECAEWHISDYPEIDVPPQTSYLDMRRCQTRYGAQQIACNGLRM